MIETGWTAVMTAALALAGVLAVLVLGLRALRGVGLARGGGRRLAVEEAVALDGRRRLVLVRCDGRHLLLLTGSASDSVVGWLPPEPPR